MWAPHHTKTTSIKLQQTFFSLCYFAGPGSFHLSSCIHFIPYIDWRRGTSASFNHHYDQNFCNFSRSFSSTLSHLRSHSTAINFQQMPRSLSLSPLIAVDDADDATISNGKNDTMLVLWHFTMLPPPPSLSHGIPYTLLRCCCSRRFFFLVVCSEWMVDLMPYGLVLFQSNSHFNGLPNGIWLKRRSARLFDRHFKRKRACDVLFFACFFLHFSVWSTRESKLLNREKNMLNFYPRTGNRWKVS